MMAAGVAAQFVAVACLLAAMGVLDPGGGLAASSTLRLALAGTSAIVAPLFWPGCGEAPKQTIQRVLGSSLAAAAPTAAAMLVTTGRSAPAASAASLAILVLLLVVACAATALLEQRLRRTMSPVESARETASSIVCVAMVMVTALPLWFGPAAEALRATQPWLVDAAAASSPLTHLAVAADSDLFHTPWIYEHANIAMLQLQYPPLGGLLIAYAAVAAAAMLALGRTGRTLTAPT